MNAIQYSIVIPIYNESRVIKNLYSQLTHVMETLQQPYELIFVEDGSNDNSLDLLKQIAGADQHVAAHREQAAHQIPVDARAPAHSGGDRNHRPRGP